jgi:uncharacterized protein
MNKLVIGSANFGMKYGFKNSRGKLNPSLVGEILDYAWINNINTIDTAKGYGESESVIGDYLKTNEEKQFRIITKINTTESPTRHLYQSLANLNQSDVYGVLIHNFDYFEKDHSLFDHLLRFKEEGRCKKIGISLYYPEELQFLIDNNIPLNIIQIAYSIFDRRFEVFFPILKELDVEIHVRSVFLQGLFFTDITKLGHHFDKVKHKILKIQQLSASTGLSIASICLNFANNNNYIDNIIIGIDNLENLESNIQVLSEKENVQPYIESLNDLTEQDVNILFPHFWKI